MWNTWKIDFSMYIGILAGVLGLSLLFAPGLLKKIDEWSARMVTKLNATTFSYRIGFGVSLLIASAFMLFMAYYFTKRH